MQRFVVAIVAVLVSALGLHGALPHAGVQPVAIQQAAIAPPADAEFVGGEPAHPQEHGSDNDTERLGLPSSTSQSNAATASPVAKALLTIDPPPALTHVGRLAPHQRPGTPLLTPSPVELQIFRC